MNSQAIPLKFDPHTNPNFASQELWIYNGQLMDEGYIWMRHECIHMIPNSRVEWRDEKGRENFGVQQLVEKSLESHKDEWPTFLD